MDLEITFNAQIEEVQRRLRECNFECNRLKDLVAKSLPELIKSRAMAEEAVLNKTALIASLESQLATLQQRKGPSSIDAPLSPPASVEATVPTIELSTTPIVQPEPATVTDLPVTATVDPFADQPLTPEPPVVQPVVETTASAPASAPAGKSKEKQQQAPAAAPKSKEGLEDFIGGNILGKIGIGILVIGIGIFVKYAIDQDWIGSVGRVMIGLGCGSLLMGIAHYLRKTYKAFSSILLGGGIAVLYFSVAIAYHQYHLLGQAAAFGLMCGVTGASVFFSLAYNRQEIAVLALLGAFATPFMVSNGSGNYVVLFSYILVVNIGMLVLAWFRDWRLVRILGYALTLLLFGGWVGREYMAHDGLVPAGGLVFASLFFVTFFMTTLAYRVRKQEVADAFTYISLLSNSVFFYGISMLMIQNMAGGLYMGIFTAGMAVFHFAFILPLRKLLKANDHVQTLLIGLVLTFVTLAIPIQLDGNYITLFWIAEAMLVLYLGQRAGVSLLRVGSVLVSVLAVIMLCADWSKAYLAWDAVPMPFLLNGAFLTSMLVASGMVGLHLLRKRGGSTEDTMLATLYQFASLPLFYLGVAFELVQWLNVTSLGATVIGMGAFTALYLSAMLLWAMRGKDAAFANTVTGLGLLTLVLWAILQPTLLMEMRDWFMSGSALGEGFPWHLLSFVGMLSLGGLCFWNLRSQVNLHGDMGKLVIWGFSILAIILMSLELEHVLGMLGMRTGISRKVGYPILWGIMGFGMIALGMREKLVALRIGGLALFLLILLKLFLFDIRDVSAGGKIAAFVSLGVLLLVISFMYQRLRKLLTDKEESETQADKEE
jgi:uncharacterized membrane protein